MAIHPVHGQYRRPIGGFDHLPDGGHRYPRPLSHHRDERLVLGGLDERRRRASVADIAEPDEPVSAVQQVGIPLVRSEDLDEQRLSERSSGTGYPSSQIDPVVGLVSPSSIRIMVVLPAPFGPRYPNAVPVGTRRSTRSTAVRPPNRLVSLAVSTV